MCIFSPQSGARRDISSIVGCPDVSPSLRNRQAQVVYGECQQQYLPVNLLVAPPYPGAVLAHDFVLVESGCQVAAHVSHHYDETQPRAAQRGEESVTTIRQSDRRLF